MKQLLRYFIIRTVLTIPMVFVLLTIVFVVLRIMPGDPIKALMGVHAKPEIVAAQRAKLGLDKPIAVQYVTYLWQVAHLDFGKSIIFKQDVVKTIMKGKLPATLELSVSSIIIALIFGVLVGAIAADKRRSPLDYFSRIAGIVVYCIPIYWLGLMFQLLFGVWLDWLPVAGRTGARVFASA
ncbi:MAG: ABC transporter permease, partial [Deltaproteobacteria bacterium]|nr:ABC transporter permease [Deltaproteobacteria bacterium]